MNQDLRPGAEPVKGYTLIERLGRGGFGEVWKATGPGGFQVALKFVSLVESVGPVELRALEVIKHIRHPHLLGTFGSWQDEGRLIIAMELAERTLLDRFREAAGQGFPGIPAPEIFEHFLDASKALDFLNEPRHPAGGSGPQGIQHRDVKPQNLLLLGGSVKVADFGLARVLEHSETGHTGSLTPSYAAPEFFDRKTSSQSDQYSLAITYCHLRGGRLPFEGNPAVVMAGHLMREPDLSMVPEPERPAVARALSKTPRDRWPSCRAFVQAVMDAAGGPPGPHRVAMVDAPPTTQPMTTEAAETSGPVPVTEGLRDRDRPRRRKRSVYTLGAWSLAAIGLLISTTVVVRNSSGPASTAPPSLSASRPPPAVGIDAASVPSPIASGEAFRPLFNGKDLAGWKTLPGQPGDWSVEDGKLVGRNGPGYLFSERGDFEDFHLRVEARVNATGNSGVYFRSGFGLERVAGPDRFPDGYEAQIALEKNIGADRNFRTGSLYGLAPVEASLVPPDTWFAMDVIAAGNRILIRVDGKDSASFTDDQRRHARGHLALQVLDKDTRVEFREIEWKELPPNREEAARPRVASGLALLTIESLDKAIAEFDEAIRLDPKAAVAFAGRSLALSLSIPPGSPPSKRRRQIHADSEEAIRLDPKLALALVSRAFMTSFGPLPDTPRALADCDEAIRLEPGLAFAHATRAHIYLMRGSRGRPGGDLRAAAIASSEAIRLEPRLVAAYHIRANTRRQFERFDDALADLDEAERLNPNLPLNDHFRGMVWKDRKQNDRAIACFTRAIRMRPDMAPAYRQRADAYDAKGDRRRAEADRKDAARLRAASD